MALKRDSFFLPEKKQNKKNINNEDYKKKDTNNKDIKQFEKRNKRQSNFDENRDGLASEDKHENNKKPFDKKAYRLKKYSKKYKLEQWEEQRKKKLLQTYHKSLKNESLSGSYKPKTFDDDATDGSQTVGRFVKHPDLIEKENSDNNIQKKKDPFWKAKEHYNKIKEAKQVKQQEIEKSKQEKQQKLQEYKKKKQERYKKLSKKTKKGQPMMTGRLELLLDKIQRGSN